jgi:hypothetical protein
MPSASIRVQGMARRLRFEDVDAADRSSVI